MSKAYASAVLDAPVDVVWEVVGDFLGIDKWMSGIGVCERIGDVPNNTVGCVRRLVFSRDGATVVQRLLSRDVERMTFSYTLADTNLGFSDYVARVRVVPVTTTDQTFIEWAGQVGLVEDEAGEEQRAIMREAYSIGLSDLAATLKARKEQAAGSKS
ncbi:MAG: SRPBCC family protein [Azospirillaceae bacterium]|nr:SRPBCC family protein [Azospirillaceae bacterium]